MFNLFKSSKKEFENRSVETTKKNQYRRTGFFYSIFSKIDRLRGMRKEMVK